MTTTAEMENMANTFSVRQGDLERWDGDQPVRRHACLGFRDYLTKTTRTIPVVVLERV
jgi:hypothetical protein